MLQLCAAGRSRTLRAWCCLLIGPRPMTRARTASGVSMWKRTRGSCLTSKCKRLHSGVRLDIRRGGQRGGQIDLKMLNTLQTQTHALSVSFSSFTHIDTRRHAHGEEFLWSQSLIRFFFFFIRYIKNSV